MGHRRYNEPIQGGLSALLLSFSGVGGEEPRASKEGLGHCWVEKGGGN